MLGQQESPPSCMEPQTEVQCQGPPSPHSVLPAAVCESGPGSIALLGGMDPKLQPLQAHHWPYLERASLKLETLTPQQVPRPGLGGKQTSPRQSPLEGAAEPRPALGMTSSQPHGLRHSLICLGLSLTISIEKHTQLIQGFPVLGEDALGESTVGEQLSQERPGPWLASVLTGAVGTLLTWLTPGAPPSSSILCDSWISTRVPQKSFSSQMC